MHINNDGSFSLQRTTDVTPEQRQFYSSTSIWNQPFPSQTGRSMTFLSTPADVSCSSGCFLVSFSMRAAPASRDDTLTLLTMHSSIFNLSFLETCINSECNKRKTPNQFFHVVHTSESAANLCGCTSDGLSCGYKNSLRSESFHKIILFFFQKRKSVLTPHKNLKWELSTRLVHLICFKVWKDVDIKINVSRRSSLALMKNKEKGKAAQNFSDPQMLIWQCECSVSPAVVTLNEPDFVCCFWKAFEF